MKVKIDARKLNTDKRKQIAKTIEDEMSIVINSPNFKRIFTYLIDLNQTRIANPLAETSNYKYLGSDRLYHLFMSGWEELAPDEDKVLNVELDDYYSVKRVIGYTYPNIRTIFVNTKYFDRRHTMLSGSNIVHEYGHKLGFNHTFKNNSYRKYSLCYLLNDIYEQAYREIFPDRIPKVSRTPRRWYHKLNPKNWF